MPGIRQLLGSRGEAAAARYLRRRGYVIFERNYRCRFGEIDLIALDRGTVVFIEVKTRTGSGYGNPIEAVHRHKQRQVVRVAEHYVYEHHLVDRAIRFDVVGVMPKRFGWACDLVRDAFQVQR